MNESGLNIDQENKKDLLKPTSEEMNDNSLEKKEMEFLTLLKFKKDEIVDLNKRIKHVELASKSDLGLYKIGGLLNRIAMIQDGVRKLIEGYINGLTYEEKVHVVDLMIQEDLPLNFVECVNEIRDIYYKKLVKEWEVSISEMLENKKMDGDEGGRGIGEEGAEVLAKEWKNVSVLKDGDEWKAAILKMLENKKMDGDEGGRGIGEEGAAAILEMLKNRKMDDEGWKGIGEEGAAAILKMWE